MTATVNAVLLTLFGSRFTARGPVATLVGAAVALSAIPEARGDTPADTAVDAEVSGQPLAASPVEVVRVAIPTFRGRKGAACAGQIAESLRSDLKIVRAPRSRPAPDSRFEPLAKWLTESAAASSEEGDASEVADVWLVGRILPGKVIVEVYDVEKKRLLGVGRFWPSRKRGCRLSAALKARVVGWATRGPISTPKSVRPLLEPPLRSP